MMRLSKLIDQLERLVPPAYAQSWDKVGLLVGDPGQSVNNVVLALDLTSDVIRFSTMKGAQLIICHHPTIFSPLSTLRTDHVGEALLIDLIKSSQSLVAMHTNLDAVPGGVADQFARLIGLTETRTLAELIPDQTKGVKTVSNLWNREYDVKPGFGRVGLLQMPTPLSELTRMLREQLQTPHLLILALEDRLVSNIAVCPGSFDGEWIPLLRDAGCELLICGEIKHHVQLELFEAGLSVIAAGHDVSERVVLEPLAALLREEIPEVVFAVCPPIDYNKVAF